MVTAVGAPLLVKVAVPVGTAGLELQLVPVVHSEPPPVQVPSTPWARAAPTAPVMSSAARLPVESARPSRPTDRPRCIIVYSPNPRSTPQRTLHEKDPGTRSVGAATRPRGAAPRAASAHG